MADTGLLPLFPLGTVLFPGLLLPLRIFEPRYLRLVADLREGPEPRRFGVIAIREGRETGTGAALALHEVGCTATIRRIAERGTGELDLVTVGTDRFRLVSTDDSAPYLRGEVELLAEEAGDPAAAERGVRSVQQLFGSYLAVLADRGGAQAGLPQLPGDPSALSFLVAASLVADLPDRQALLAQPDAARRLAAERAWLSRELAVLRALPSTPAPELRNRPYSPN